MREKGFAFDLGVVLAHLPEMLGAFGLSVAVAVAAMALATAAGLLVAVGATSRWRVLVALCFAHIQVFRGVALYVLIIWVYFGLAITLQVNIAPTPAGILTLALLDSAYLAEIFRTGLQKVDRGQREAGAALGLSDGAILWRVVVPQAVRSMIPAIGNQFTDVLKDTSILAVIAVPELMYTSQSLAQQTYRPFEFYTVAGVLFVIGVSVITYAVRVAERRVRRGAVRGVVAPAGVPMVTSVSGREPGEPPRMEDER